MKTGNASLEKLHNSSQQDCISQIFRYFLGLIYPFLSNIPNYASINKHWEKVLISIPVLGNKKGF